MDKEDISRITELERPLAWSMRRAAQLKTKLSLAYADLNIKRAVWVKVESNIVSKKKF